MMDNRQTTRLEMRVYQYPACSTCKKAIRWLREQGFSFETVHIVDAPPSLAELADYVDRSRLPLKRFFNTSGQSYRQGGLKEKLPSMSAEAQLSALVNDGKLIRRPLVVTDDVVLVGFNAEVYDASLKPGRKNI